MSRLQRIDLRLRELGRRRARGSRPFRCIVIDEAAPPEAQDAARLELEEAQALGARVVVVRVVDAEEGGELTPS